MEGFLVNKSKRAAPDAETTADVSTQATARKGDTAASLLTVLGSQAGSIETVRQFLTLINEADKVHSTVERVAFANPLTHFKLIEIDNDMAEKFTNGTKLVFRGDRHGFAALCTENETYSVKEVETSNSMLILRALGCKDESRSKENLEIEERQVLGLAQHYLQLTLVPHPSIGRLRDLLRASELTLYWEDDSNDLIKGHSFEELLEQVQMSDQQLRKTLKSMPVVEHRGRLRWLSCEMRNEILNHVIDHFDSPTNNDTPEKFTFEGVGSALPRTVTDSAFKWFLSSMAQPIDDNNGTYRLLESAFVRARAAQYLQTVSRVTVATFEEVINTMLPIGVSLNYDSLRGICLIEESIRGRFISYLSIEDLPEDPRERLHILFEKKGMWKSEEMSAFLVDICTEQRAVDSLLLAQCRSFTDPQGQRVYCGLKAL